MKKTTIMIQFNLTYFTPIPLFNSVGDSWFLTFAGLVIIKTNLDVLEFIKSF